MVIIREYLDDDLHEVVCLWYRSWKSAFPNLKHPQIFEEWKSRFKREYATQSGTWIVTTQERILGFMVVSKILSGEGVIDQIFVDVDVQRKGIGTALISRAKQISPNGLKLRTLRQNLKACRFYEKHGFITGATGINPINQQPNIEYYWIPPSGLSRPPR